ncbi:prion-inhibition and propagation-domain-containing protein [Podospora didyma]|uniref:Prion-inhibition and propagation-domain-containing protein n=1 Tax=Podospora didyma TaxID=330526 RepID=A0AAE0NH44_9PEZI|nr:prion-inhibition and propagation-domain-containing protein [Podospora didyma]
MEPLTTAGGIIGTVWDVFDNAMRLFKFFSALVDMPKECEKYRLQLVIEYNRVLAWGKAAGLVDVPKGASLGVTLGTNATELVAIIARIGWVLAEFRELNARYGNELNPEPRRQSDEGGQTKDKAVQAVIKAEKTVVDAPKSDVKAQEKASKDSAAELPDADVVSQVSSLAVSYEAEKKERLHLRGTNHIRRFAQKAAKNTKEIVTHPVRVRWVAVDKEEFETLLSDLHVLTERLHELMRDYRDGKIDDITAKTYREMIMARNSIEDLKDMFDAVSGLITTSSSTRRENDAHANDKTLQDLIQLKKMSRTSETILSQLQDNDFDVQKSLVRVGITVKEYTDDQFTKDFEWNEDAYPSSLSRPRGILTTHSKKGDIPVWVEWKTLGKFPPGSFKDKEATLRTVALAEMLSLPKPASLHAPTCLGYFDDRDISNTERYGWIFAMPEGCDYDTRVVSLYGILGQQALKPSLSKRVVMASALCSTLLNLHAVNWLHKGIFSENVVFHFAAAGADGGEGSYDPEKPVLSGFEFSRPDGGQTTVRHADTVWDVYRWPGIQRERPTERNSRKTYDLYSLGLVLLEIAHWQPLYEIMHLGEKRKPQRKEGEGVVIPLDESKSVRDWLLGIKKGAPFELAGKPNPLAELRHLAGDRYYDAVKRCLWAHGEKGFGVDVTSDQDSGDGIVLQKAFTEHVVEALQSVHL